MLNGKKNINADADTILPEMTQAKVGPFLNASDSMYSNFKW